MANIHIARPKVVADPIYNTIDIAPYLPIINTREFQALSHKLQLGTTTLVFPGGKHTRLSHSLGTCEGARSTAAMLYKNGMISKEEKEAIAVDGLIHDIGHGPFSHVTEDFCEGDNNEMTRRILNERLKPAVEDCGVDVDLVISLSARENPLYQVVHDKNLGADKLDYLERDGLSTIHQKPGGLEYLRQHLYFIDGTLAIDERAVDTAIKILDFYATMYRTVYFRKGCVIAQRMFEKNVYKLIQSKSFDPANLPYMTDAELLAEMYFSKDLEVQFLYKCYRERHLFQEAIVMRPERFAGETSVSNKNIFVHEATDEEIQMVMQAPRLKKNSYETLETLERSIAMLVGVPHNEILVVPVFDEKRFKVQDVSIYGSDGNLRSLQEQRPEQFESIKANAGLHTAFRVCTHREFRKKLSSPSVAKEVIQYVLSVTNDPA